MPQTSRLRRLATSITDFLLPALCPGCGLRSGRELCGDCRGDLALIRCPCPRCASPRWQESDTCQNCGGAGLPGLAGIRVHWSYEGSLLRLIGAAKGAEDHAALRALADLLPRAEPAWGCTAVVPVPAAPGRRSGPHLARVLAHRAARTARLPFLPILVCTRLAAAQHQLSLTLRKRNVQGLFRCRSTVPERVLLVDDLLTSGATCIAAAMALRQAGAREVRALCLARTPRSDEAKSLHQDADRDPL